MPFLFVRKGIPYGRQIEAFKKSGTNERENVCNDKSKNDLEGVGYKVTLC